MPSSPLNVNAGTSNMLTACATIPISISAKISAGSASSALAGLRVSACEAAGATARWPGWAWFGIELAMRAILQCDLRAGRRSLEAELADAVRPDMARLFPVVDAADLAPDRPQRREAQD